MRLAGCYQLPPPPPPNPPNDPPPLLDPPPLDQPPEKLPLLTLGAGTYVSDEPTDLDKRDIT